MNAILTITKLTCRYNEQALFAPLSFSLLREKCYHLQGPNGGGKTTLLKTLLGIEAEYSGEIHWQISQENCHYIAHKNAIHKSLTPVENMQLYAKLLNVPVTSIITFLKNAGLAEVLHLPCRKLSAGQCRRVALSRLFLAKRALWILDEPFTSLDAEGVAWFSTLMAEHLQSEGTVLCTSHQSLHLPGYQPEEIVLAQVA